MNHTELLAFVEAFNKKCTSLKEQIGLIKSEVKELELQRNSKELSRKTDEICRDTFEDVWNGLDTLFYEHIAPARSLLDSLIPRIEKIEEKLDKREKELSKETEHLKDVAHAADNSTPHSTPSTCSCLPSSSVCTLTARVPTQTASSPTPAIPVSSPVYTPVFSPVYTPVSTPDNSIQSAPVSSSVSASGHPPQTPVTRPVPLMEIKVRPPPLMSLYLGIPVKRPRRPTSVKLQRDAMTTAPLLCTMNPTPVTPYTTSPVPNFQPCILPVTPTIFSGYIPQLFATNQVGPTLERPSTYR